jgi:hypothetical protein
MTPFKDFAVLETHFVRLTRIALALVAMALIAGCGKRGPNHESPGRDSSHGRGSQPYENPATVPHPSPSQPAGPQIGKSDSLLNAIAPRLMDWVSMWRAALPGFRADSMWGGWRAKWSRIHADSVSDDLFRKEDESDVTYELLGLPSPDGRYLLHIDRYQYVAVDDGELEVGGDVDSHPILVDQHAKTFVTLDECGTPCGYHWGRWLSPTTFALAGWHDADEFGQWRQGGLSIYSIPDSSVVTYATRIVSRDSYDRYETAWEDWLLKRYRAVRAHHRVP